MTTPSGVNYPWLRSYPQGIAWDAPLPVTTLPAMLEETAKRFPRAIACDYFGYTLSYKALAAQVERCAAGLRALGVTKGERIGIFLPNCPQFVIVYYAILKAGGVVVNFNPLHTQTEVKHHIEDAACETMVTLAHPNLYPKLAGLLGNTQLRRLIVTRPDDALPFPKNLLFRWLKKKEQVAVPRDDAHVMWSELLKPSPSPLRTERSNPVVHSPGDEASGLLHFARNDREESISVHPDDLAVLQYTGGTTGVMKAAMLTHANLTANCAQCGLWFQGMRPGEEAVLGALPLFHVFAMTVLMNFPVSAGLRMILHPKVDLNAMLRDIQGKKPSLLAGVPTLFAALNQHASVDQYDLTSLHYCISGGAPLPVEVKKQFEARTGCTLVEGYGLSETSPVVCVNPFKGENRPGSIGLPLPCTVIEIVSLDDRETVLPQGEAGELCIRGPQVMQGYRNQPEETAHVLRNGRLHTGDVGYIDADGYVFIVDRCKDMIITGGYNVYPRQVEEAIHAHPDVVEAAVIGAPHAERGQIIKAFVVRRHGSTLTSTALRAYLREHLTGYQVPHQVEFMDALPKSAVGKVLKRELT